MSPSAEDYKSESYKAFVERRRLYEAEQSERRRQAGQVAIWLDRSPDDAPTFTRDHQAELREVLGPLLRDKELEVHASFMAVDAADAVSGYTGELIVALASIASPLVTHVLVAWLQRKPGRKLRIEFHPSGKLKSVEAQTDKQVLSIVEALKQEACARKANTSRDPGRP